MKITKHGKNEKRQGQNWKYSVKTCFYQSYNLDQKGLGDRLDLPMSWLKTRNKETISLLNIVINLK